MLIFTSENTAASHNGIGITIANIMSKKIATKIIATAVPIPAAVDDINVNIIIDSLKFSLF
jgi:hypothetical protein